MHGRENNNKVNITEIVSDVVNWIHWAQDRDSVASFCENVMSPQKVHNSLTS